MPPAADRARRPRRPRPVAALVLVAAAAGCGVAQQLAQLKTFAACQFRLASVGDVAVAGIAMGGKRALGDFTLLDGLKLRGAVASRSLPLALTVNVEVRNPNDQLAAMNRMAWVILLDGRELARGAVERRVEVPPNGGVATLPVRAEVNLTEWLAGGSLESMLTLAANVAGEGTHPSHVTLKVTPTVVIAGTAMDAPELSVTTEFGAAR